MPLRAALRERSRRILVGETARRSETIQLAITAAETGQSRFATLHTSSAARLGNRMVDGFPPTSRTQVTGPAQRRLAAIFAPDPPALRSDPSGHAFGRVMAPGNQVNTPAVANLIREGKTAQIYSQLQTGRQFRACRPLENAARRVGRQGASAFDEARSPIHRPDEAQPPDQQAALSGSPWAAFPRHLHQHPEEVPRKQTRVTRNDPGQCQTDLRRRAILARSIVPLSGLVPPLWPPKGKPGHRLQLDLGKVFEGPAPAFSDQGAVREQSSAVLMRLGCADRAQLTLMANQQKSPLFSRSLGRISQNIARAKPSSKCDALSGPQGL